MNRPVSPNPLKGHAWFNFDDSRVSPIRVNEIEKQFQGKESAYMLFYRKRTLSAVEEGTLYEKRNERFSRKFSILKGVLVN